MQKTLEFITNRITDLSIIGLFGLATILGTSLYNTNKSLKKLGPQLHYTSKTLDNAVEKLIPTKSEKNYKDVLAYHPK